MIREPRTLACLLPWLLAGLAGGCGAGVPAPAPEVLYAGCAEAGEIPQDPDGGWICWLDPDPLKTQDRKVRLWVDVPRAQTPELRLDGEPLVVPGTEVRGGLRFEIPVSPAGAEPMGEGRSVLEVRAAAGAWTWRLTLAEREPAPSAIEEALRLWRADEAAAAFRILEDAMDGASPAQLCRILRQYADLEGGFEPPPGERSLGEEALRDWARAAEVCRAAGRLQSEADHRAVRVYRLILARRFGEAHRELAAHPPPAGAPANLAYFHRFYRGQLATEAGDFRSAGDTLRSAVEVAEKVGLERERRGALEQLALLFQTLGQTDPAGEIFHQLERAQPPSGSCDRARVLSNHAWTLLLAREAGNPTAEDPIPLLEQAGRVYAPDASCERPEKLRNVAINLALADLQEGRPETARRRLVAARGPETSETLLQRLWRLDLEARVALGEHRPGAALDRYRELDALASETLWPEGRWRAALGRARALEALGDRTGARTTYGQAEDLLDQEVLRVAVHGDRAVFLAQRERATREYLDLLLTEGGSSEVQQALEVARRSRARVLRSLWRGELPAALTPAERQRWYERVSEHRRAHDELDRLAEEKRRSPLDELPRLEAEMDAARREVRHALDAAYEILEGGRPGSSTAFAAPAAGELLLVFHPLPTGWVGFAASRGGVESWRFELPPGGLGDLQALSARLLEPAREAIEKARIVHILAYGALRSVDLHALPFGPSVLLAAAPVVYQLDLPRPPSPSPGGASSRGALVVSDPRLDLPAARTEGEVVAGALRSTLGRRVTSLAREQAGRDAVLAALTRSAFFHYAGHGRFRGWESDLPLADGRLTLGDVLGLEPPPAGVVLSACDSAASSEKAPQESIGLAQAFLLAGSRWVLAADRPVGDEAARGFFGRFYGRWDGRGDPAAALREAQLAWREASPRSDWASFRLLVP